MGVGWRRRRTGRLEGRGACAVAPLQVAAMAGQEDPVQREIHQDWANREYIEVITSSIKKIADFLNSFGQRASRGWWGWVGGHSGSLARALRSYAGAFSGSPRLLLFFASSGAHLPPVALTFRLHWAVPVGFSCARLSLSVSLPSPQIH